MRLIFSFLLVIVSMPLFSQKEAASDTIMIGDGVFEKVDVEATFSGGESCLEKIS